MAIQNYDPLAIELQMLDFWAKKKIYENLKKKNSKGKNFYYLDGPPYTSGKVHLGTAWGKALRDSVMRYKRMNGFNVWDRAGFDTHGLPTEHKVQEKFDLKTKDEIPKFGIRKFVQECKKLCNENKESMIADFKRIGIWMDFENPYMTLDNSYIEGEWWLIKKAHENGRLYEGEKVMHWCANCATATAKHELEYENIKDDSIFLKFKVKDKKNEFLIIWTTTPWTIPYNLGVMVNPEEDYIRAKVGNETWITAAALAGVFIQGVAGKQYKIIETFKGQDLEGLEYIHPLNDELEDIYKKLKQKSPKVHTVLLSEEYVDTGSGSGLVHMAPGCGPEDYEVGYKNKILPFNNLNEDGSLPDNMGPFAGFVAKRDDSKFIDYFKEKGFLIETTEVEHEYAHCWRCHKPVVFRLTKQFFFKVEDLKEKMRALNKMIFWQPDWAGNKQFDSWLDNLRDNSITRQRFWGCPAPIWKCSSCSRYEVIGSIKELEKKSRKKAPADLHKPDIDNVTIPCSCKGTMHRIPDILDVWVDAGVASWTCLNYPQEEKLFKKLWPADFILEGKDQIRGWFNLLFVASMVSMEKPSYKAVYMHGFINDSQGRKMSKSLGNYILPEEVISKYGADTLRYYMIGAANPGLDLNYNFEDMKIKNRNLTVLWNIHKFLLDLAKETGKNPAKMDEKIMEDMFGVEEQYIFSRLNSTIEKTTNLFSEYLLNEVPLVIEELFLDLSRTYIQLIRDKAAIGEQNDKEVVLYSVYKVLLESLKIFSPVAPFITEAIFLNLKETFGLKHESIHSFDWPKTDKRKINAELEQKIKVVGDVIQAILAAREKMQLGLKWPIKEAIIVTSNKEIVNAVENLTDVLKSQTNIKAIVIEEKLAGIKQRVKPDYAKIGPSFGSKTAQIIAHLTMQSPETIMGHISREGKYKFKINDEEFTITKEHLLITREIPAKYAEAEARGSQIYLDKERTDELEAEGYAREVMRRVQSLRKESGLEKSDRIYLHVTAEDEIVSLLKKWEQQIALKCGAEKIVISEQIAPKKHSFAALEKIKGKKFEISFDKR